MPNYKVSIKRSRKRKKTISLRVLSSDEVQLSVPYVYSQKKIQKTLESHSSWIEKTLQKFKERGFNNSSRIHFLGQSYDTRQEVHVKKVLLKNETFFYPHNIKRNDAIHQFFKAEAIKYIPFAVDEESKRMNLRHNRVSIKNQKTRWGSCSSKKNLNFNYMLMQCPKEVIRYVIIHELCHLKHMNHSQKFWNMVEGYDPKFKTHIKQLRTYSTQIM